MAWLLVLVVIISWFILFLRKKLTFKFGLSPKILEIQPIKGLKKLNDDLERSLTRSYMENVEERVKSENKLKENEYEWRLLDLKRFFVLTSLLNESPMFSKKVDELWHQMLMFTREYDDFSRKYLGTTLHHSPNVKVKPDPDLRGFFDWVYAELFLIRKENIYLYKGFFRHPVHPTIIEDFKNLSEDELINLYFKSDTKYQNTVLALIASMKKTVKKVRDYQRSVIYDRMKKSKREQKFNSMLVPFLSVSYFHYEEFSSYMKMTSDSSSSCTSCGSGSDSSCSSSSCSSDSSCSSCGGGSD
ncbi:hypothetical protein [Niallia sp.]|uniref:hypothetical protein n=1 Tax=Niallia sp. TaxID=2837523 RepID=UPI002897CE8A|nr:hypothetical protein [Niallia sp.]